MTTKLTYMNDSGMFDNDEYNSYKINLSRRVQVRLSTDKFGSSNKGKEAFDDYCKSQSGEVKSYFITPDPK
jgi:hypothetical protein